MQLPHYYIQSQWKEREVQHFIDLVTKASSVRDSRALGWYKHVLEIDYWQQATCTITSKAKGGCSETKLGPDKSLFVCDI